MLFGKYIFKYKRNIILAIIAMVIVAAGNGANAYMIRPMLDHIFISKNPSMLYSITFIVFGISVSKGLAAYFQSFLMKTLGQKIITDMQVDLYRHLIYSDLALINSFSTGKLISRFTIDINTMRSSVSVILTGIARDFLSIVFLIGVMFYQNWFLSLIAFTVFPLLIYPVLRLGKRMRKIAIRTQEELGTYTVQLDETFKNIRIIKSYANEEYEISKAKGIIDSILNLFIKAARTESLSSPIMESISGIAIALVIWYGGLEVINGTTTAGSFFSFIAALIMAYKPIKTLTDLNTNLQEGLAASKRFFTLLNTKPTITSLPTAHKLEVLNGNIEIKNITFDYPNGKNILNNFSLNIPAGKTVALVGESGSGKSTIINLLLRLYDCNSGEILIDNQEIKDVTLKSLRDNISIVTQEVAIFDDTIINNIAYGRFNASEEEIIEASKAAAASVFIEHLPHKYQELVGHSGIKLSGGQRQRIAIARAILKNAPIMILDEATSSLDNITEAQITENLKAIRKGKTTIIVAHRLSTIINADVIFVMKNGNVIESGTHEALINKSTYYKKLYTQASENE
ncbi:MAG: ATP-binding cassette domain-containing protein [Sphingobacteriia bacterium]|nr:ATP-binding cassette domain-containing protein [Sphingobacteriia bacterium]